MRRDKKAEVLWFRVAPQVAEVGKTLVGNHPNQENAKNRLKEEAEGEVGNEDAVCADVVLHIAESKDEEALKEEEEQDGNEDFRKLVECEDVAPIVPDSVQARTKLPDSYDHVAVEDAKHNCACQHYQSRFDVNVGALS